MKILYKGVLVAALLLPVFALADYSQFGNSYSRHGDGNTNDQQSAQYGDFNNGQGDNWQGNEGQDQMQPSINELSITSSDASSTLALPGDTVTISFTTNEPTKTPIVLASTRPVFVKATSDGTNAWQASYTVGQNDPLGPVRYLIALVSDSGEPYLCSSVRTPFQFFIKYCPPTNGSSVIITHTPPKSVDTIPPVISPVSNVTAEATGPTGVAVTYTVPTATDDVDGTDPVSCTPAPGSTFALGTTTVTCTSSDAAGNTSTSTFSVVVQDTIPPIISSQANITAQATSSSGVAVTYTTPTATDAVDGTDTVSCTPVSDSTFSIGTTTVTCTSHDAAGNVATSEFDVIVTPVPDTLPPVISAHADVTATLPHAISTSTPVTYTTPTATDDVDGTDPVSCAPASGSLFGLGTTTVTCMSSDAAGNTATSTFHVIVNPFVPQPITLASQSDESYLCYTDPTTGAVTNGWRACYTGGGTSFTTNLGAGSGLAGALQTVTVALDPAYASSIPSSPFRISVICYTDASYSTPCTNWVVTNANHDSSYVIQDATHTTDNEHWTADFTSDENFNNSSPVTFIPSDYYQLKIEDQNNAGWPAYGQNPASTTNAQPYWMINGITQ